MGGRGGNRRPSTNAQIRARVTRATNAAGGGPAEFNRASAQQFRLERQLASLDRQQRRAERSGRTERVANNATSRARNAARVRSLALRRIELERQLRTLRARIDQLRSG